MKSDTVTYYFDEKPNFLHTFLKLKCVKENLSQAQKHFTFNSINVLKKLILTYGKPAMKYFKYHGYLYGSEVIYYVNAILRVVTEPAL